MMLIFMPLPHVVPHVVWSEATRHGTWFCPVRLCMHPETLTQYFAEYLSHFHQAYINNALWDRDEFVTIWGKKIGVTVE